jgi:hypothetical protein
MDVIDSLSNFNAKVSEATDKIVAMCTVQIPGTAYDTALGGASDTQAAGLARDNIVAMLVDANDQAQAVASLVTPLLPLS